MLFLAAAALAAQPASAEVRPARQARAAVTIIRSERLRFAEIEKTQPNRLRSVIVRSADGADQRARLIEFE